jgi:hypothetical protein
MGQRRSTDERRLPRSRARASDLEEIGTRFRVTLRTERVAAPSLDDADQVIVAALSERRGRLTSEIAAEIGLTARATRTRLERLGKTAGFEYKATQFLKYRVSNVGLVDHSVAIP